MHNIFISKSIIGRDLVKNEYLIKLDKFILPNIIFCFKLNYESKIDKNIKITGEYLDELTSHFTYKRIFDRIYYYNRTHEKRLDINELEYSKKSKFYPDSEIVLTHFYYLRLKCFEIKINLIYLEEEFYFKKGKKLLIIFLNSSLYEYRGSFFLMCKKSESNQIEGSFLYKIGKDLSDVLNKYTYAIDFELFKIKNEDNFLFLKELLGWNQKTDSLDYFGNMKKKI